jgi:ATP-dependent DNA helicase RecQ
VSSDGWRSLIRQLIHKGYLQQEMGEYPVLKLAPAAVPLLKGEETLMLARPRLRVLAGADEQRSRRRAAGGDRSAPDGRGEAAAGVTGPDGAGIGFADAEILFDKLRVLRRALAEREGVPAYVIFHDATLREMAAVRPTSPAELLDINGVGQRKLEKYGDEFLELLRSYTDTVREC